MYFSKRILLQLLQLIHPAIHIVAHQQSLDRPFIACYLYEPPTSDIQSMPSLYRNESIAEDVIVETLLDVDAFKMSSSDSCWRHTSRSVSLPSISLEDNWDQSTSCHTTPSFEKLRSFNRKLALTRTNSIIETAISDAVTPPSPGLKNPQPRRTFTRTPRSRSFPSISFPTVAGVPIPTANATPNTTIPLPLSAIGLHILSPAYTASSYPTGTYACESESETDDIFCIGSPARLVRRLGESRLALSAEYQARLAPFVDSTPKERNSRAIRWKDEELFALVYRAQSSHAIQRGQGNRPRPRPLVNFSSGPSPSPSPSFTATATESEEAVASTNDSH
ncbi:hypothetical protein FA15DRAFT_659408 [Coprinopsis marcescibilis]|uniref:Uncharacterized protein n=1 Tax=Coprinopsis marcescibilis TaxID=230819 RepID=A0A5C3KIP5_COPMA|nr:hypothetical protein FA15DRAFT_659408 [Coprinopsis marcescibilis]